MNLQQWILVAKGRLALDPRRITFEDVRVTCRRCGGVTVFSVHFDQPRPTPAPCAHCVADI